MSNTRLRRLLSTRCLAWWIGALLLSALQPFIAVHFRSDGWEDEPGVRIRPMSQTTQFEQDDRAGHSNDQETTLYVPQGAGMGATHAIGDALGAFLALLALALPLAVLPAARAPLGAAPSRRARPRARGGAPPGTAPWRSRPPALAPPPAFR